MEKEREVAIEMLFSLNKLKDYRQKAKALILLIESQELSFCYECKEFYEEATCYGCKDE